MNNSDLKKLAKLTVSDGETTAEVEKYVLEKLTRTELKAYLFYLKQEIKNRKVFVRTAGKPDKETIDKLKKLFEGRSVDMNFEQLQSLGAGIQIEYKDNLVELSLRNLISRSLENIRESL